MDFLLTPEQVRIVAALMEKEVTTPDYYPMTLNSLVNACNQKSCREPVMNLDEGSVSLNIDVLRDEKGLIALVSAAVSRVPKYKQRLTEHHAFEPAERAVLCELMLRGPQTPGELRNRAERMHPFKSLDEIAATLKELETREDGPWVQLLPRLPGHKEARYAHLLSGPPVVEVGNDTLMASSSTDAAPLVSPVVRIQHLEEETARLREDVQRLSDEFARFRAQFEG